MVKKIVYTSCPHDCGGKCLLKVHVENGVIKKTFSLKLRFASCQYSGLPVD